MKGMGEGKSGVMLSPEKATHIHRSLEVCCQILAFLCGDPVYRVYVACLVSSLSNQNKYCKNIYQQSIQGQIDLTVTEMLL